MNEPSVQFDLLLTSSTLTYCSMMHNGFVAAKCRMSHLQIRSRICLVLRLHRLCFPLCRARQALYTGQSIVLEIGLFGFGTIRRDRNFAAIFENAPSFSAREKRAIQIKVITHATVTIPSFLLLHTSLEAFSITAATSVLRHRV